LGLSDDDPQPVDYGHGDCHSSSGDEAVPGEGGREGGRVSDDDAQPEDHGHGDSGGSGGDKLYLGRKGGRVLGREGGEGGREGERG